MSKRSKKPKLPDRNRELRLAALRALANFDGDPTEHMFEEVNGNPTLRDYVVREVCRSLSQAALREALIDSVRRENNGSDGDGYISISADSVSFRAVWPLP